MIAADQPAPCALSIAFGSYAMGIDGGALERVEALLASDGAVTGVERKRWGREGEVTLCVDTRSEADARRLANAAMKIVPDKPRGPITISTAGGFRADVPSS